MDARILRSFKDELEKISAKRTRDWLADWKKINPEATPKHAQPKKAKTASPAGIGAGLGAGLSLLRGGMREWDQRLDEDRYSLTPEQKKDLRRRRLVRMGAGIAVGAGAGALAGHFSGKAVKAVSNELKQVTEHGGKVLDSSIDRLGGHYKAPFSADNAKALGQNLAHGLKDGIKPNFMKRLGSLLPKKK